MGILRPFVTRSSCGRDMYWRQAKDEIDRQTPPKDAVRQLEVSTPCSPEQSYFAGTVRTGPDYPMMQRRWGDWRGKTRQPTWQNTKKVRLP